MLTQEDLKNIENLLQPKFDQINQRLDNIEFRIDKLERRVGRLELRIDYIEKNFREFREETGQKFKEQSTYIYMSFQNQLEVFKQTFVTKDEFEKFKDTVGFSGFVSDKPNNGQAE
jgi:hypothetical protein